MKTSLRNLKVISFIGLAGVAMTLAAGASRAQLLDTVPPPMSHTKGMYFKNNPAAWSEFLAQRPHRSAAAAGAATNPAAAPAFGGSWQTVTVNNGITSGLSNPELLTDGTVIFNDSGTQYWWKLTPDSAGNYADGTWTQIASLPVIDGVQYSPLYFASAVLPDGRFIIMGGEYQNFVPTWTNDGAIYDPVSNTWTAVNAPTGWGYSDGDGVIGDSESVVLADGTWMLPGCCNYPDQEALLDAATLTWTFTGAPNAGGAYQDEQGYQLLPNGNVLTNDIWTYYPAGGATNAEQYVPTSGVWISAGNTPVSLVDPAKCGNWEIGPAVMRPDGTLVAFGGNTGCKGVVEKDPTAIYNTTEGTWSAGKYVPSVCGPDGTTACDLADAPGAMMPNGNILFAASSGYGNSPTHFFEFTSKDKIEQVADELENASTSGAYYYNFLVLPNGQILATDFSNTAEVYTAVGSPKSEWAPTITSPPKKVTLRAKYTLTGTQFNGLTQGAYYGDDEQGATNYPIVRLTNKGSGNVLYARTVHPNTMSIAPGTASSVTVTIPALAETGLTDLVVIANGIASKPVLVDVVE
jgi:Kelch motif protein